MAVPTVPTSLAKRRMAWEWRNEKDDWRPYPFEINEQIMQGASSNMPSVEVVLPGLGTYTIDLKENKQI